MAYKRGLGAQMAYKTSREEAATRKLDRMFDDEAEYQRKKKKPKKRRPQAVKVPGKMGPSRRNEQGEGTRKDDRASRKKKLVAHFKKILSGKSGRMQGKK